MQLRGLVHIAKHSSFLFRHPRVFMRALIELFRGAVLKQDRLRVVEWIINSECNSKCIMCYATKYNDPGDTPLSPSEIERVWKECEKQGAFLAILEGGEATLRKDFDEVVKALHPERNIVVLVSNSLILTEERIKHYKEIGVAVLHLSLNSVDPAENDRIRGAEGHYRKVMNCVKWGKKAGMDVYFSSMLTHNNREEFIKILELARGLKVGVSGALVVTQGRYEKEMDERLTEEDRKWLCDDLLKKYSDVLRFDWNTNLSGNYECPAGREKVSISLYGEVMACVCNHLGFGNVRKEPFDVILKRMNDFPHFKEKIDRCIISFDTDYRRKYMDSLEEVERLPVNIFRHPVFPAELRDGKIIEKEKTSK